MFQLNTNQTRDTLFGRFVEIISPLIKKMVKVDSSTGLFYVSKGFLGEQVFNLMAYKKDDIYIQCKVIQCSENDFGEMQVIALKKENLDDVYQRLALQIEQKCAVPQNRMKIREMKGFDPYRDQIYPDIINVFIEEYGTSIKVLVTDTHGSWIEGVCRRFYPSIGLTQGELLDIKVIHAEKELIGEII